MHKTDDSNLPPKAGRVIVRRGRRTLALQIDDLGPDDEVLADDDPYFRKKGRPRVVVEAWREHLGSFVGVEDLMLSPSWEGLAALAAEGVAQSLDAEARRQRQHMPAMFGANPCLPPPHLLKAIRAHASNWPYRKGRPARAEPVAQRKTRVDELVEEFSDDAIAEIAAELGVTPEEVRA